MDRYQVIVVGGGHAGTEAAWAAARMGMDTALVTMSRKTIGAMSCNPAIGGLGKGQMVREIDALGGLMGLAIDRGGIQFRMLNRSKGPAVWAPRAQADRCGYADAVQQMLAETENLTIVEASVEKLRIQESDSDAHGRNLRVDGVELDDGRLLSGETVILTTGTFLRGLMHFGPKKIVGGRVNEPAAKGLSDNLRKLGFTLGRLKTGTPPRVHRETIDLSPMQPQSGDVPPIPFSFLNESITQPQVDCWITHTNARTHALIRNNLHRAPMYSGQIQSTGPRYCPSIEDKIVRFPDKLSHQLFLEPEGYDNPWIYCNGIPTSLPEDVQVKMVHSIAGLEQAEIVQFGYAIEYDWVPTDQIDATLETKRVAGLFLAGQINGTSGYEEAGGQGLLAAINAKARLSRKDPVILGRDQAYIGVMIDDLITRPPDEPYRMFTSRAEYRLHLRSDNADMRLAELGRKVGLVDDRRWAFFQNKRQEMAMLADMLKQYRLEGQSLYDWVRKPRVSVLELAERVPALKLNGLSEQARLAVEIEAKYAGYLEREQRLIDRYRQMAAKRIPADFDYAVIAELRNEAREKFTRLRPLDLGQASRISGISPADIATLSLYLFHRRRTRESHPHPEQS